MSWEIRLGGSGNVEEEGAFIDALAAFVDKNPVGYSTVRSQYWGEGDLATVAAGGGARSPGEAAAYAEAVAEAEAADQDKSSKSKSKSDSS